MSSNNCRFHGSMRGCRNGNTCPFSHNNPNSIQFCRFYNRCRNGNNCRFRHIDYQTVNHQSSNSNDLNKEQKEDEYQKWIILDAQFNGFNFNLANPVYYHSIHTNKAFIMFSPNYFDYNGCIKYDISDNKYIQIHYPFNCTPLEHGMTVTSDKLMYIFGGSKATFQILNLETNQWLDSSISKYINVPSNFLYSNSCFVHFDSLNPFIHSINNYNYYQFDIKNQIFIDCTDKFNKIHYKGESLLVWSQKRQKIFVLTNGNQLWSINANNEWKLCAFQPPTHINKKILNFMLLYDEILVVFCENIIFCFNLNSDDNKNWIEVEFEIPQSPNKILECFHFVTFGDDYFHFMNTFPTINKMFHCSISIYSLLGYDMLHKRLDLVVHGWIRNDETKKYAVTIPNDILKIIFCLFF